MYTKEYFMDEIDRAYNVLGRDNGELQNETDIAVWLNEGYIDILTRDELRQYNRAIARRCIYNEAN